MTRNNEARTVSDRVEKAIVAKHYRDTGEQLQVCQVDVGQRTIQLGDGGGSRAAYHWTRRSDCSGFRFTTANPRDDHGAMSPFMAYMTETEMYDAFEGIDKRHLTTVGKLYLRLRRTFKAVAEDIAGEILGHGTPPDRTVSWIASTLAGEPNPTIESDLDETVEQVAKHLTLALSCCVDEFAVMLGITSADSERTLSRYDFEMAEPHPPEEDFAEWAQNYLMYHTSMAEIDSQEEATAAR